MANHGYYIILCYIISDTYVFISCFFIHVLKFEFTAHLKGALVDICSCNRFSHIHLFCILHNVVDCVVGSLDLSLGQKKCVLAS